jgi:hypothetical protein
VIQPSISASQRPPSSLKLLGASYAYRDILHHDAAAITGSMRETNHGIIGEAGALLRTGLELTNGELKQEPRHMLATWYVTDMSVLVIATRVIDGVIHKQ